jgi:hypothetical protein
MDAVGIVITVLVVALLWVAAVAFGRDSRDGCDWPSRGSDRDRSSRTWD